MLLQTPFDTAPPLLAHHSEPGDPTLLAWIQDRIDAILGLGPETVVFVVGLFIVSMPIAIMVFYLTQRSRMRKRL